MPSKNDRSNWQRRPGRVARCAVCGGKFGLIRHYCCRTALCSKTCVEHFKHRRQDDNRWLWQFRLT